MASLSQKIYANLTKLYPDDFQQQHGVELQQTFEDMVKDFGLLKTWTQVLPDFFISVLIINLKTLMEKSSLQFKLALWGIVCIAPFAILVAITITGNALHMPVNDSVGQELVRLHLAKFILFGLPLLAFFMNLIPLLKNVFEQKQISNVMSLQFVRINFLSLAVAAVGGIFSLFMLHDAIPCMAHGILNQGLHNIGPLLQICRNA